MFDRWIRSLGRISGPTANAPRRIGKKARQARQKLFVSCLEDRTVPAGGTSGGDPPIILNTIQPYDALGESYDQSITATGGTGTINLTFNIQTGVAGLSVQSSGTDNLSVSGTPTATGTESFTVTATDSLGETVTKSYTVTVVPPIKLTNLPDDTIGIPYDQSIQASGGEGAITLTVSDVQNAIPGLTLQMTGTGSLSVTGTPTAAGQETFTVVGTDAYGDTTVGNYALVTDIDFASGSATHFVDGDPDEYTSYTQGGFSVTPDAAVDGTGAHFHMDSTGLYTHIHDDEPGGAGIVLVQRTDGEAYILNSLTVPELSAGGSLTFADSAGDSMTVTTTGTYQFNWGPITSFSITPHNLLDSLDQRGYVNNIITSSFANYQLTSNSAITLSPTTLPSDIVGSDYDQSITAYHGTGLVTLTVSNIKNAIPGLTIPSSSKGAIEIDGNPTASGTETFTVTATDGVGATTSAIYTIAVNPTGPAITLSNLPDDTVGVAYSQSITASGGTGPITLTVSDIENAVPGISIQQSGTGSLLVSGTPTTSGTETFIVTATDSAGDTTTGTYGLNTTIDFTSGTATHLADGDPDEFSSYTQGGYTVTPVAADGVDAHFHLDGGALYTHVHDDEAGGPGIVSVQRADGAGFILNSLTVPQLSSGGSLTFADSAGHTMTVTTTGTYQFDWGPITSFTITPNNLLDSLDQRGYVDNIVASSLTNYALTVHGPTTSPDTVVTTTGTPVKIPVLSNVTPDANNPIDPSTVNVVTEPAHGTVSVDSSTGVATYTPSSNFTGIDSFDYTVTDAAGVVSVPAVVRIKVDYSPEDQFTVAGAGAGGGPAITVYNSDGTVKSTFFAFSPTFTGGVVVAEADLNGDGVPDIIAVPGTGGGPVVEIFDGATLKPIASFYAYNSSLRTGLTVAVGDVTGDGIPDIVTGTGEGGGPQVNVFSGANFKLVKSFFAYDPSFRGGVNVAVGDVNGDGHDDIATGAGVGGGPLVNVFSGSDYSLLSSTFAFAPSFRGGVTVAFADTTGDGLPEVVAGAGLGGAPQVAILNALTGVVENSFFAYASSYRGGVQVGSTESTQGTQDNIIVGPGPGEPVPVVTLDGGTLKQLSSSDPYEGFLGGVNVAGT